MIRLQFVVVYALVALSFLAYSAYQDALDIEHIVAVVVFLVIAVPVGIFWHRRGQRLSKR